MQLDTSGTILIQSLPELVTSQALNQGLTSNLPGTGGGVVSIVQSGSGAIPCQGGPATLIPGWCANLGVGSDVLQYQADIAQQFLSVFHINAPDGETAVQMILQRANLKLLEQYYAFMLSDLEAMIAADPSTLTTHQANVLTWLQSLVWTNEQNEYNAASAAINTFENSCNWQPDPDIAAQYNLNWTTPGQCISTLGTLFGSNTYSQLPPKDYFLDVGMKKSYGQVVSQDKDGTVGTLNRGLLNELDYDQRIADELGNGLMTAWQSEQQTYSSLQQHAAEGSAAAAAAWFRTSQWFFNSGLVSKVQPYFRKSIYQARIKTAANSEAATDIKNAAKVAGNTAEEEESFISKAIRTAGTRVAQIVGVDVASDLAGATVMASSGPAIIVGIFLDILVQAIQGFVNYEQTQNDYTNVQNLAQTLQKTPPTLAPFLQDDTGQFKLAATLAAAAYPLPAFVNAFPVEQNTANLGFLVAGDGIAPTPASSVQISNWNGVTQTITLAGDWFTESDPTNNGQPVVSRVPMFHFIDWTGRQWWAARFGDSFLVTKSGYETQVNGDPFQDIGGCGLGTGFPQSDAALLQPQQQSSSVQNAYCSSYVTNTIQAQESGRKITVQIGAIPTIQTTGNGTLAFQPGVTARLDVPIVSNPQAQVQVGGLPPGFTSSVNSDGSVTLLDTNLTSKGGISAQVTIIATNAFGSTRQNFTLLENAGSDTPVAQGPASLTLTGGQPVNFNISFPTALKTLLTNPILGAHPIPTINLSGGGNTSGVTAAMIGLTIADQTSNGKVQFNVSGTPTLNGIFEKPPDGTAVTGSLQLLFSVEYYSVEQQLTVWKAITYNLPFSYTPTPDPEYNANPIVMYNGLDNTVNLTSSVATSAQAQFSVEVLGGSNCMNKLSYALGQNNTIILRASASATKTYQAKNCGFSLQTRMAGDDTPPLAIGKTNSYDIPITFLDIPQFTSIANPIFQAGSSVNFPITLSESATVTATQALPVGLQLVQQGSGYAITGTPPENSGGEYKLQLIASGKDGTSTQNLDIRIWQSPVFSSPIYYNIPIETPYTIDVIANGYPNFASDPCAGTGMSFSYANYGGLPNILSGTNQTLLGTTTNQYQLTVQPQGLPGFFPEQITATNQAGSTKESLLIRFYSPAEISCGTVAAIRAISGTPTNSSNFVLDYNNDGVIDSKDLLVITKYLPKGAACQ
ncbi:MAG: hypothetical protein JO108_17335 [Acidobacteriaceae bacterium]|nr:hypothetical protein [Acidobacteriaceae bacterium]